VSGRVLDDHGAPLANAKLKFYAALDGSRQGTTRDDTDAAGNFSILLPLNTFNVNVEAPASRDLLVSRLSNVVIAGPTSLGDIPLPAGQGMSGLVIGPGGGPIQNVNVNVVDAVTRSTVRLAHDSSNKDGTFRVVVPSGTYDIQYGPPACTQLAPDDQTAVGVQGVTALPPKQLVLGAHVTGPVTDDAAIAAPVVGADLDFYISGSTTKAYTPGDTTDASGAYDVLVKPALYDIDVKPPAGSRLRPVRRPAISVSGSTVLSTTVLPSGRLVSGTVHALATGLPVGGTAVEVHASGGGPAAWTVHNDTAPDGSYLFAVDAGTWDLEFVPPSASGLAPRWMRNVAVSTDIAVGDTLLLPLMAPTVAGATPSTGWTSGGTAIAITGTGFQPDATVRLGGSPAAGISVLSSTSLVATAGPHPAGTVGVEVENPGAQVGARPAAFTYVEPSNPVVLRLGRSGSAVTLTWGATGQPSYTVFRSVSPGSFSGASIIGTTTSTTLTDTGAGSSGTLQFYNVD
ncbi:MAG TPA: IPT/TIG domain-containing protein, partial [Candidatus Polarisedimenticolaceae bacterium]|nr:IPT/TIG domain-containing protein [Candidatus Polarisedimenticolaceae bacterium]